MSTNSYSISMIVRNAEDTLEETLAPFIGKVEHISIVLGGVSSDDTPVIARRLATLPVIQCDDYDPETGRLMNFAGARNLSFDQLEKAGAKWALVVDAEETWKGTERLPAAAAAAEEIGAQAVICFGYEGDRGGEFEQMRLYRIGSGRWESPVHNVFKFDAHKPSAIGAHGVTFFSNRVTAPERRLQNIEIAKAYLEKEGPNLRTLLHLALDTLAGRTKEDFEAALEYANRYLVAYDELGTADIEELFEAHYTRAICFLSLNRFLDVITSCLSALAIAQKPKAYATAAEAAVWAATWAGEQGPLMRMAIYFADNAIALGKPRGRFTSSIKSTIQASFYYKAVAHAALGELRLALGACDLGLLFGPEKTLEDMKANIASQLGVIA